MSSIASNLPLLVIPLPHILRNGSRTIEIAQLSGTQRYVYYVDSFASDQFGGCGEGSEFAFDVAHRLEGNLGDSLLG